MLKKAFYYLIGYNLLLISIFSPRFRNIWLFGGEGNSKYLFLFLNKISSSNKYILITKFRSQIEWIRSLGYQAYYRWSLKGIFYSLIGGKYIFSSSVSDINLWTVGRAKRINLWHGVGIKNIEFKCTIGPMAQMYNPKSFKSRLLYPEIFMKPDLFLSTSPLMTHHFSQCFRISEERCVESKYPRNELLLWSKQEIKRFCEEIKEYETIKFISELESFSTVYIYMPTWRDACDDFLNGVDFDLNRLNSVLCKSNDFLILKLHPDTKYRFDQSYQFSNIRLLENTCDVYQVLPFTDVLITDYSSIYYDYILMPDKKVLLFPFDEEEYCTSNRDLAFDYKEYTPGVRVYDFISLLEAIKNKIPLNTDKIDMIRDVFWRGNNENLYNRINSL